MTSSPASDARLRASEQRLAFLLDLSDRLRPIADPRALLDEATRALGVALGADRAGYAEDHGDDVHLEVSCGHAEGLDDISGLHPYENLGPALLDALRAGQVVVRPDVTGDSSLPAHVRDAYVRLGLGATLHVPLVKGGRLVAFVFAHTRAPRQWTPEDVTLLQDTGERIWAAVERARAEARLRANEARLKARAELLEHLEGALASNASSASMIAAAGDAMTRHFIGRRVNIIDVDEVADAMYRRYDSLQQGGAPLGIDTARFTHLVSPTFAAHLRSGGVQALSDVMTDPRTEGRREPYAAWNVRAQLLAPLVRDGQVALLVALHHHEPCTWTEREIEFVREVAARLYPRLERARAEEALRRANEDLDARVAARTAELAALNAALAREVGERRAAEARIQALYQRVLTAQEEERRRIARDIHDHVGQQITALRLALEAASAGGGDGPPPSELLARSRELAHEVDQGLDALTWELRPTTLEHLGLGAALAHLVEGWASRFGVPAEFHAGVPDSLRLAPEVESHLYRIAQEALHNVFKHAQATCADVLLENRDGEVVLIVEDDGRGFDVSAESAVATGMGLTSLRERAALIGARVEIESAPGEGTAIYVRVPMPTAAQA
ncbi:hypothetical protein TBR22_A16630 [Luteitalea sp. TBR-22]|uniref:GAF domain-containing sensor histidine kinase n=1 Tax=Luteitalea sp. TBR-22 TaxID=2802971 RepID=UPI001AF808A7|nr:GAF domain-containing sensor histidine kinase [Luteitalea sp. TBR-22]BCS32449.1 hypothetical protein TBR22_A16630 [Luteitalea sp. TBR-22]